MAKEESGVCRICNEYDENSRSPEFVYSFSNVVSDIKETLGIEILVGPDIPTSVCEGCISSLETAQKFRQKCIRSNEYYSSISLLSYEYDANSSKETKIFDSNANQLDSTIPTAFGLAEDMELSAHMEHKDNDLSGENPCNEAVSKGNTQNSMQEHSDKEVSSKRRKIQPSERKTRKCVKKLKNNKLDVVRKRKDKCETPVICDICGNVFKAKHVFALHLRRHSNIKPYDCELCSSRFYTNSELKRHMRRHTGEKPYECQFCHRKFSDYGTLTKHIRIHTNDRPFSCKQCGKSFSCTFVLKNHMLIHTGERAFRCEVCDKSFGRLHNLTTHMKSIYHQRNVCMKENKTEVC